MKKISCALFLFVLVVFCNCSNDSGGSKPTISFKMNGVSKTAIVTSAILFKSWSSNEKWLEIVAQTNENTFMMKFNTDYVDDDAIPVGNYLPNAINNNGTMYVSYRIGDTDFNANHLPVSGSLIVSAVNINSKKVSGTFNHLLHAAGQTDDFVFNGITIPYEIAITDGIFSNLHYTIGNSTN